MTSASVIIPTRGGSKRLPRLLRALANQSMTDWEAIIVVDGDIDNTAALLQSWPDERVHAIVFSENRGRVAALNAGFEAAKSDVLIRCDDDLEPSRDYVATHVNVQRSKGPCGVIGIYKNVLADNPYARAYGFATDERFRSLANTAPEEERWLYWAGNCSMHRTVWETVGPYDSRFRMYGWEDADYGYRIFAAGFAIYIEPSLETLHHAAAVTTEGRVQRAFRSGQARNTFDAIHGVVTGPGPTHPTNDSIWNVIVNGLSRVLTYERAQRAGKLIDSILPVLPHAVGKKSVAMLVETAAVAGNMRPKGATNDV